MNADLMLGGGVIPEGPVCAGKAPEGLCAPSPVTGIEMLGAWYGFSNPAQQQVGPSCGGNATANVIEAMLRRDCPQPELFRRIEQRLGHLRWQVDGDRLWRDGRLWFYDGDESGGLTMFEIGMLPDFVGIFDNVEILSVAADVEARREALERGPLVIGLALGAGWAEPDATTGYIVPGSPNPRAGHAVSLVAMHRQGGCFEAIMNSWGGEWGRWGYGLLNSEWLTYCQIDTGRQWVVEKDWWERSAVWDFIIEHRGGAT